MRMDSKPIAILVFLLFLSSHPFQVVGRGHGVKPLEAPSRSTYIVRVHRNPSVSSTSSKAQLSKWYKSFLPASTASVGDGDSPQMIYEYSSAFSGFAVRLTERELMAMKQKTGFVHAYPDRLVPLQTTHTPDFLGLRRDATVGAAGFWRDAGFGKGIIIGVLDTGISPGHPSFSDQGMPAPPAKWKGACEFNASDCNNKLIGARSFTQGAQAQALALGGSGTKATLPQGPYDHNGHGTHTAGTAAGAFVDMAGVNGLANGTAAGMAPLAHLAVYKVCDDESCADSDILAGLDSAVSDGVDVLSISLGGSSLPFYNDSIAIGTFGAIEKGIFVSCAAGNSGPFDGTLSNEAPWMLTVGASTTDRAIRTTVTLGNGNVFNGESAYQPSNFDSATQLPLVYPGSALATAAFCGNGSLDGIDVKGMAVVCDEGSDVPLEEKGEVVKRAGGAAMIIANSEALGITTIATLHVLPASHVSYHDGLDIKTYINSSSSVATASITFKGTIMGVTPAPAVAYFSSRGPNQADPNMLKPDIVGPGVNILAAWPSMVGTSSNSDHVPFNIISGTSMATPHLSGIAALLKSMHPDWSPAAIKSAIMTTADQNGNDNKPIKDQRNEDADFFSLGSGHVNPSKANNPGLIYDIEPRQYVAYVCGLGYRDNEVSAIARRPITCSNTTNISSSELNYPSFMVSLNAANNYTMQVTRTVTNVGAASSNYTLQQITSPVGSTSVIVEPQELTFSKTNEKAQFSVTFTDTGDSSSDVSYSAGYLIWASADKSVTVTSPIVVALAT